MFKLFQAELKKIWTSKKVILSIALLLAVNFCLLLIFNSLYLDEVSPSEYKKLGASLSGLSEQQKGEFIEGEIERYNAYNLINNILTGEALSGQLNETLRQNNKEIFDSYLAEFSVFEGDVRKQYRFYTDIGEEFNEVSRYQVFLDELEEAAQRLSSISIFQNQESGFDIATIEKTAAAYENLRDIEIEYFPEAGLEKAINFRATDWVLIGMVFFLSTAALTIEKEKGLLALVASTPRGRFLTAVAKLFAITFSLLPVVLLFYLFNLVYCSVAYGLFDLSRSVQSVPFLMHTTLEVTVAEYLALFFAAKWLALSVIGFVALTITLIFRTNWAGYLGIVVFLAINFLQRLLFRATGDFGAIKYANCISLLDTNELLGQYFCINIGDIPYTRFFVEFVFMVLFSLVVVLMFVLTYSFGRRFVLNTKKTGRSFNLFSKRMSVITKSVFRVENYKLLISNKALFILILYTAVQIYFGVSNVSYIHPFELRYKDYMLNIEGRYDDEAYEYMLERWATFEPLAELERQVSTGEISNEQFSLFLAGYSDLLEDRNIFRQVSQNNVNYVLNNNGAYLLYDTGYQKLFDLDEQNDIGQTLFAMVVLILCMSDVIAKEKASGLQKLIKTTPLGRQHTAKSKLRLCVLVGGFVGLMSYVPSFISVARDYGLSGFFYPAKSLQYFSEVPIVFGIYSMFLFMLILRTVCCIGVAFIISAISAKTAKITTTLAISSLVFCVMPLMSMILVEELKLVSVYPVFHLVGYIATNPLFAWLGVGVLAVVAVYGFVSAEFIKEEYT